MNEKLIKLSSFKQNFDISKFDNELKILENKKKLYIDISLVVSTHNGQKKLFFLLLSISKSNVIPREIIIIGTNVKDFKYIKFFKKILNVIVKISNKADQIHQRKIAFNLVTSDYILQSDDDIEFEKECIEIMYKKIKKNNKIILCPLIIDQYGIRADNRSIKIYKKYLILRLIYFVLNGFKRINGGVILNSGRPVADVDNNCKREWLNSLLFFAKENLIHYETFKNKGKAFYEDVYTSHSFFQKGFKLIKINEALVIHQYKEALSFKEHIQSLSNQYKIVKNFKKSKVLFILDVLIFTIVFLIYK